MARKGRKFGVKKPIGAGKKSPRTSSVTPGSFDSGVDKVGGETPVPKKKFGVKNPVARGENPFSAVESCPVNCPGEWVNGMWIHSQWCKWGAVLWKGHGKTVENWNCPFGCVPIEIPSGWTHPWNCVFWDETNRTPFDHNAPKPGEVAEKDFFADLVLDGEDDLPF